MPILGIIASSITGNLVTNSYESISTISVTTNTSSIQFASIPSTFKHLQIRYIGKSTISSNYSQAIALTLNNDAGSNYSRHYLIGYTGGYAATTAGGDTSQTKMSLANSFTSANFDSAMFGAGVIDILDYALTTKYKTVRNLGGAEGNDSSTLVSTVSLASGLWQSTSAITSVEIAAGNGQIAAGSKFALYGIRG